MKQKRATTVQQTSRALEIALVFFVGLLSGVLLYGMLFPPAGVATAPTALEAQATLAAQGVSTARMPVLAVRSDNDQGVATFVDVEIRPGKERILINTNPFVEPDTQESAETAVNISQGYTRTLLKDRDIIITFNADTQLVGGPSAGGAMTVALIAAIEGKAPNPQVAMTGTIEANGRIGPVGGVIQKAQAAAQKGYKKFLIPQGSRYFQYYESNTTTHREGGYTVQETEYVPRTLDLKKYAMEKWGLDVVEVPTIKEAAAEFGL